MEIRIAPRAFFKTTPLLVYGLKNKKGGTNNGAAFFTA